MGLVVRAQWVLVKLVVAAAAVMVKTRQALRVAQERQGKDLLAVLTQAALLMGQVAVAVLAQ
jgi:hypothetical protein